MARSDARRVSTSAATASHEFDQLDTLGARPCRCARRATSAFANRAQEYTRDARRRAGGRGMLGSAALQSSGSHHMPCLLLSVLFIPSSRPPPLPPLSLLLPPAPALPLSSPAGPGPDPVNPTPRPATPPHYLRSLSFPLPPSRAAIVSGYLSAFPFLRSGSFSPVVS
jgi:hypothetical protein